MKKIILLLLLFFSYSISAQYYNNRDSRRRTRIQNTHVDKRPDNSSVFNINRYLGIVIYDSEKAVKKIGLKPKSEKGKKVKALITEFNKSLKQVIRINTFTFKEVKNYVEASAKKAKKTGDYSEGEKVQKTLKDTLKPFADILEEKETDLDNSLKEILSEKKYKKWNKFKKKAKKTIK